MKHVSRLFLIIALSMLFIITASSCETVSSLLEEINYSKGSELTANPITDVRWMGFDADKVGVGNNSSPDGTMDGHFRITLNLPGSQEVSGLRLFASDASGNKGASYWYTSQDDSTWILGAFSQGRLLNAARQTPLGMFTGIVDLDVYATNDGSMTVGSYFLIECDFSGIVYSKLIRLSESGSMDVKQPVSASPGVVDSVAKPVGGKLTANPIADVRWMGFDADKVGVGNNSSPDGAMDGHFRITLNLPGSQEVSGLRLFASDASGNKGASYWYTSQDDSTWILGAFSQGRLLNAARQTPLGMFTGIVDLDVYATNDGSMTVGSYFLIECDFSGIVYSKLIRLSESGSMDVKQPVSASPGVVDSVAKPVGGKLTANPIADVRWMGFDADKVGVGNNSSPDGTMDGHFRITLNLPGGQEVSGLRLFASDASGNKGASYWYTSQDDSTWVLGAFSQGRLLNAARQTPLGMFTGIVDLDVYATNDGSMTVGSYFLIECDFSGVVYSKLIRL